MVAGKRSTLPAQTQSWINDLLKKYEEVFSQGLSIKEIVAVFKESRNVDKRALL